MNPAANPVLVEAYRGGVLESFHRGAVCAVDSEGKIIYSAGDPYQISFPRSAMKFFQQIPLIEEGAYTELNLTKKELAVMCGSHNGEEEHIAAVDSILSKAGLDRSYLKCGAQTPTDRRTAQELIRNGEKPQPVHNNCSGKHAGFLALAVYLGADPSTYTDMNHPVQQKVLRTCEEMYEYPSRQMITALDGCSAPIFSMPLYNQAIAYKNLVSKSLHVRRRESCRLLSDAVSEYPFMLAGTGRYCTDMMNVCGGKIIGKTGAEGVYCMALKEEGVSMAVKVDDGKMQPQYNVAQKFISRSGLFASEELAPLQNYMESPLLNFNKLQTGHMKVSELIFPETFQFR